VAISIGFASRRTALGLIPTVMGDAWHLLTVEVEHPASGASAAFSHDGWIDLVRPRVRLTPFVEERGAKAAAPTPAAEPAAPAPAAAATAAPASGSGLPMTALLKEIGAPSPARSGGSPGFGGSPGAGATPVSVQALQALAQQRSPSAGAAESAPPPPPAQLPASGIGRTMPQPPVDAAPRKSIGKRLLGLLSPKRGKSPSPAGK